MTDIERQSSLRLICKTFGTGLERIDRDDRNGILIIFIGFLHERKFHVAPSAADIPEVQKDHLFSVCQKLRKGLRFPRLHFGICEIIHDGTDRINISGRHFIFDDRTYKTNGNGGTLRIRNVLLFHVIACRYIAKLNGIYVTGSGYFGYTFFIGKRCALHFPTLQQSDCNVADRRAARRLYGNGICDISVILRRTGSNPDRGKHQHDTDQQRSDNLSHDKLRPPEKNLL